MAAAWASARPAAVAGQGPARVQRAFPQASARGTSPSARLLRSPVSHGSVTGAPRRQLLRPSRAASAEPSPPAKTAPPAEEEPPELELTTRSTRIGEGVVQLTVSCAERFAYEVEYSLGCGTSENAYLLKSAESCVLVGLPDDRMAAAFLELLKDASPGEGLRAVTHVVIPHFQPKRLKALVAILQQHPSEAVGPMQIVCGNAALVPLRSAMPEQFVEGEDYAATSVRSTTVLRLGSMQDSSLTFTLTPTPRWPDHFTTYHPPSKTLLTSKLFSSHIACKEVVDSKGWEGLQENWYHYFDCTLSASAKQSAAALQKLAGYALGSRSEEGGEPVSQIAPMHGVVVRSNLSELVRMYGEWTQQRIAAADQASVAVIYASAYGNTTALAQAIARGISKAGVGVESLNCELSGVEEVAGLVERSGGFALGSPTLGGHMPTPVQEALGAILNDSEAAREKPCGVFGSFGWSGEAIDMMQDSLKDSGFQFAFDPIRCKFKPTLEMLQICEESGTDLAQRVLKEKRIKKRSKQKSIALDTPEAAKAVGRLIGPLCVVTTECEDASTAMLASWVSQASFVPPGITVAVAKERAAEGLLLTGSPFVLSVLAKGRSGNVMKQLLKPFKPGEDRFAGYEVEAAEQTGLVVVPESASYLECEVASKMDVGDHWIVYGQITAGKVLDEDAEVAIHHRKAGTHY